MTSDLIGLLNGNVAPLRAQLTPLKRVYVFIYSSVVDLMTLITRDPIGSEVEVGL